MIFIIGKMWTYELIYTLIDKAEVLGNFGTLYEVSF